MVDLDWSNVPKDMCPVCKTDKYLSPEIQFKINPECYHKICDACVDRIFSLGPSPCPYPGCDKILRKNKFKTQVFDDLEVEKECDIRRRVLSIYNKKESEFASTDEYNTYTEEIEDTVYDLLHHEHVAEIEAKLKQYSMANKQAIELNNARRDQEYEKFIKLQKLEKQYKSERNRLNKQIAREESSLKSAQQAQTIDQLQQSTDEKDPDAVMRAVRESMQKRSSRYKEELQELETNYAKQKEAILKDQDNKPVKKVVAAPFTPFNGDRSSPAPYTLGSYKDQRLQKIVEDVQFKAGGYKLQTYFERSLNDAFAGLGCIIESEKA